MKENQRSSDRSITLDVCKGIAIFLVVWGHVLQQGLFGVADIPENPVVKMIYSFHMPLGVLISGYLFYASQKHKTCKELVLARAGNLLKTIIIWNTIHFLCSVLLEWWTDADGSLSVMQWWNAITEGYWFLWAMLVCTIAVGITVKCMPKRFWMLGFLLFLPLILLSPCRWPILSVYPFYIAGFWYHKRIDEGYKTAPWLKYAVVPAFALTTVFYFSVPAIGNGEWLHLLRTGVNFLKGTAGPAEVAAQAGNVILYYVLGSLGSVSVIVLVDAVVHKMKENAVVEYVGQLGRFSLQIYILQRVLLELVMGKAYGMMVKMTGYNPVAEHMVLFTWLFSLIISTIGTCLIYLLARYVLGGKIGRVLFGR